MLRGHLEMMDGLCIKIIAVRKKAFVLCFSKYVNLFLQFFATKVVDF